MLNCDKRLLVISLKDEHMRLSYKVSTVNQTTSAFKEMVREEKRYIQLGRSHLARALKTAG